MNALKHGFFNKLARVLVILFLGGLLLPIGSVLAQTPQSDPFAKQLPANGARSQNLTATAGVAPLSGTNFIQDPSFESSIGTGAYWGQYSTNFGSPLCPSTQPSPAGCGNGGGTAGPHTGSVWGWFGGPI